MHGAHLMVEGKKMAKSLGNFFTLRDLLNQGFSGREIRFLLLQAHYRETFNFTLEGLKQARASLLRIDECLSKLRELAGQETRDTAEASPLPKELAQALDEDLNISRAWGTLFTWVSEMNRQLANNSLNAPTASVALAAWRKVDSVLGVAAETETDVPAEVTSLVEARQAARKSKDFKRADAIRDELKAKGWVIDDTPKGPRAKRL
jgi:cysteinyl-tRNA synthetase